MNHPIDTGVVDIEKTGIGRAYDQLYRGQKYEEALPVIHIGFLDFTLHPESPEFYATYQMLNVKNHLLDIF
mgnify:CR=1 FL=1